VSSKKNQFGYDEWSAFYDHYANPTIAADEIAFPGYYSHLHKKNVLEIGCGTGRHTIRILSGDNFVTGIDLSAGMLGQLRQKTDSSKLTLIHGDFPNVKMPNKPFDAIIASLVLEHIQDLNAFFGCARSLISIGSEMYISELHPQRTKSGVFAHFRNQEGKEVSLESFSHQEKDIKLAAAGNGFSILRNETFFGNEDIGKLDKKWERYLDVPMIQIWVFKVFN